MTREQKIEAYTMKLDGATYEEIAKELDVDEKDVRAAVGPKTKGDKAPQYEELAAVCVYPGLAQCICDNELTAKELYLLLHPDNDEKKAVGYSAWVRPRLTGKSEIKTSEWVLMSETYGVSLDVLMKAEAAEPDDDEDLVN